MFLTFVPHLLIFKNDKSIISEMRNQEMGLFDGLMGNAAQHDNKSVEKRTTRGLST